MKFKVIWERSLFMNRQQRKSSERLWTYGGVRLEVE